MNAEIPSDWDVAFAGLAYRDAAARVLSDPATRHAVRESILDDAQRDPVDCLKDAELLLALARLRVVDVMFGLHPEGPTH